MEKDSRRQLDNLLGIIHVDPKLLSDFIESVERDIVVAEQKVQELHTNPKQVETIDFLYRCMHQIKGNAAILDLKLFMEEAHKAEDCINLYKTEGDKAKCGIDEFVHCLENIKTGISEINQLISKLSHIYKYFRPKRTYEVELLLRAVQNLVKNLQESTGKKAELIYNNFDGVAIPYNCRLDMKDILVQLTRNAFHHGFESAAERKKAGKDPVGKLTIETHKMDQSIGFSFRDDGRGLQLQKIRQAARESGKWKGQEIDSWKDQEVINSIFQTGVTTVTKASTAAGRGVGMDIIKKMVEKLGGNIAVDYKSGEYTMFKIMFPLKE
jgi:chemotaxis protein histidine kinase CheA